MKGLRLGFGLKPKIWEGTENLLKLRSSDVCGKRGTKK